jgi:hypothetical protein
MDRKQRQKKTQMYKQEEMKEQLIKTGAYQF